MKIFIDTGVWFSFLVRRDQYHDKSVEIMEKLQYKGALLVTSDFVLSETYTLLMRKLGTQAALKFLELIKAQVEAKFTEITWIDQVVLDQSYNLLQKFSDQPLSLTDATSAIIVRQNKFSFIATYDRHFKMLKIPCIP